MAESEIPNTMRAWQFSSIKGGMEKNLQIKSAPTPQPKKDEALIQVLEVSLNPVDVKLFEHPPTSWFLVKDPCTLGSDFAGRVISVNSTTTDIKPGMLVFGTLSSPYRYGTLADYACVPLNKLGQVPEGMPLKGISTLGTAGITAYQSVVRNVQPGNKVLVNGGSGGVGTFSIQFAKMLGCHVVVTCSGSNAEFCRSLGADDIIDYTKTDVAETLTGDFDVVLDNVGTPFNLYSKSHRFLKNEGSYVQVGLPTGFAGMQSVLSRMLLPSFLGGGKAKYAFFKMDVNRKDLEDMAKALAEGKVKPYIDASFSFEDVIKAVERLKTGRARGKIVITVNES